MFLIFLILLPKKNELCCTHLFFQGFQFFFLFSSKVEIFLQMTVKSTWSRFSTFSLTDQKLYYGSSYLERELQVFSAPNVETIVISAQLFKELPVNGKQAARHGGRGHSLGDVTMLGTLAFRNRMPIELKIPIESSNINSRGVSTENSKFKSFSSQK